MCAGVQMSKCAGVHVSRCVSVQVCRCACPGVQVVCRCRTVVVKVWYKGVVCRCGVQVW